MNVATRSRAAAFMSTPRLCRGEATALHFYQNKQLELYASKEAKRLSLRQLIFFGRSMDAERLIKSANYVRTELPVRIAHRLRDLQTLPYVVVTQEGLARVYELYWDAFERFRKYPPITTLEENDVYCEFLKNILNEHATVIPALSLGLSLSSPYLAPDRLDSFIRRMLISRISRRVLVEHHRALTSIWHQSKSESSSSFGAGPESRVGIIFTGLNVRDSVERCIGLLKGQGGAEEAEIIIEGHVDMTFRYIREHLEYIVFELLKNALQATRAKHSKSGGALPPILITIAEGVNDVTIRVSDQGGGLPPGLQDPSSLFSFSHVRNASRLDDQRLVLLRDASANPKGVKATVEEQKNGSAPAIGIGLPMSNIYATYFGGSLDMVSLDGWGTDVYVRLPKLGTSLEGIEV